MRATCLISDLAQVRLLADPLKLKLIQAFAESPKTVRDVATELDENLTRLYRHVDALLEAGLIEITREEKKRGTVERTFQAVARRFEVEHSLFAGDDGGNDAMREFLRTGEEELLAALAKGDRDPLAMRLRIRASPRQLTALRTALEEWLASAEALAESGKDDDTEEAGVLVAFYRF